MNCVVFSTTQYGLELIISTILLSIVVIILGKGKNSADCHVEKPLQYER